MVCPAMRGCLIVTGCAIIALLLGGCAPLIFTAGAGAGYVATQEEPRGKVEAFFDDLGKSIRQTTRKLTGDAGDKPAAAARPRTGLALKIEQSSLTPSKVRPGEQVRLILRYTVAGAGGKTVNLREQSALVRDGRELASLKDETTDRENGTWENSLTFAVPESAQPGRYTVTQRISAQGQTRISRRSFTVQ